MLYSSESIKIYNNEMWTPRMLDVRYMKNPIIRQQNSKAKNIEKQVKSIGKCTGPTHFWQSRPKSFLETRQTVCCALFKNAKRVHVGSSKSGAIFWNIRHRCINILENQSKMFHSGSCFCYWLNLNKISSVLCKGHIRLIHIIRKCKNNNIKSISANLMQNMNCCYQVNSPNCNCLLAHGTLK